MRNERPGAEKYDHDEAERREDDEDRLVGDALIVSSHFRSPAAMRLQNSFGGASRHPKKNSRRYLV
jgi:hypothetical protein